MSYDLLFILQTAIVALLGACLGSFIETAAARAAEEKPWWGSARSACPICDTTLGVLDLIPVFSYILSGGKCRHCSAPIPIKHPVTEVILASLFVMLFWRFVPNYATLIALVLISFAFYHALTDIYCGYILDYGVYAMLVFGIVLRIAGGVPAVLDGFLGAAVGWGFFAVLIWVTHGGMGWGDAMLMMGFGAFLGFWYTLAALYAGFFLGGVAALALLAAKKVTRKDAIPLAPFLSGGVFICMMWGHYVMEFFNLTIKWPWK